MAEERVQRRLAAILAADVAGYSRLMGEDEAATRRRFNALMNDVVTPAIDRHHGRLVKTMGDGLLAEFASVVEAVQCAADVQQGAAVREQYDTEERRLRFRIGVHLGDVIIEGDDIHGDGVNVAARLEALAEPGGICVSDLVQASIRNKLDVALDDLGDQSLKNIADPVRVYRVVLDARSPRAAAATDALFRRPAVAVLPFENLSGDPEQEYFADGLTEDVITALSHWRSFPVIARNSSFAYKGASPDIRKVGQELGARYVVEGSVRKAGNRVRITAQLINAETGHHVWAEKYDRELEDIFALQDEMTHRIAAIIEPAIAGAERQHLSKRPPKDLNAWDLCIQGYAHIYEATKESNLRARENFERAIEIDPDYARAWTGLAYTYGRSIRLRFTDDRETAAKNCLEAARRAVALDETSSEARAMLGRGLYFNGQPENALAEGLQSVDLNPQDSQANWDLGVFLYVSGRAEEAIPWIEKALDINPLDPRNFVVRGHLAAAKICVGDYAAAVELARASARQRPDYIDAAVALAAALGHLGQADQARQAIGDFGGQAKDYVEGHPIWGQRVKDCFRDGLRKAHLIE